MRTEPSLDISTVDLGGYSQAYVERGEGPAVLLIHGSLCDCRYWKAQISTLSKTYRVISVSLRHYWPEKWDGRGTGFSIAQHSADMADFVAALQLRRVYVVGHSRGGRVALELARRLPDRVPGLILADPGIVLPGAADRRGGFREEALAQISRGELDAGLACFIDAVSGPDTWRRMVPWFQQMARDNATTLIGQAADRPSAVTEDILRAFATPTLLIGGALSPEPYPAILSALEGHLPRSERISVAGSSHGMNLGNPRVFNQSVDAFIRRIASSA